MENVSRIKLTRDDLIPLEQYAHERAEFRTRVLSHKRLRQLAVGPNTTWLFEDRLTIHYQVQEMLRTERIFERQGIEDELEAYNPLIPDGNNWKVTLLIEFPDSVQRQRALEQLRGVEDRCWVRIEGTDRVLAIADEDLDRENATKTSAVHFLRFELDPAAIARLKAGAAIGVGIDHPAYTHQIEPVPAPVRAALLADLT